MKSQIFTFSTKTEADTRFVTELKLRAAKSGQTFSFVVLKALKELEKTKMEQVQ
mgnify:CR=1 FL=1